MTIYHFKKIEKNNDYFAWGINNLRIHVYDLNDVEKLII